MTIQLNELWQRLGETNCQSFETAARGLELGFSRQRARRSIRNGTTSYSRGEKDTREVCVCVRVRVRVCVGGDKEEAREGEEAARE